jgi:hypothetical protein
MIKCMCNSYCCMQALMLHKQQLQQPYSYSSSKNQCTTVLQLLVTYPALSNLSLVPWHNKSTTYLQWLSSCVHASPSKAPLELLRLLLQLLRVVA